MGMTSFWNDVAEVRSVDDGTTYGQHAWPHDALDASEPSDEDEELLQSMEATTETPSARTNETLRMAERMAAL